MRKLFFLALLLTSLTFFSACSRTAAPPTPLAVEQIPAEMQKAFAKAKPEIKQLVEQLVAAVQAKDYPLAYQHVQAVCNIPEATKEQRSVSVRAMLTVNQLLQTAQSQGDQRAAAAIQLQKKLK